MAEQELRSITSIIALHMFYMVNGFSEPFNEGEELNNFFTEHFSFYENVQREMLRVYGVDRKPYNGLPTRHLDRAEAEAYLLVCEDYGQTPLITRKDFEVLQKRKRTLKGAPLFEDQVGLPFTEMDHYREILRLFSKR